MSEIFKKIDVEISKCISGNDYSDEDIFNLGIQAGKLMQVSGTTDFRPTAFIETDKRKKIYETNKAHRLTYEPTIERIELFFEGLLKNAVTEHVRKHWCWTANQNDRRYKNGKLDEEIASKYCIQFVESKLNFAREGFNFKFELVWKLREFVESKSLSTIFTVHYSIYGTDRKDESIENHDAIADLSIINVELVDSLYKLELAEVEKFWVDMHKPFLFMMMKNS